MDIISRSKNEDTYRDIKPVERETGKTERGEKKRKKTDKKRTYQVYAYAYTIFLLLVPVLVGWRFSESFTNYCRSGWKVKVMTIKTKYRCCSGVSRGPAPAGRLGSFDSILDTTYLVLHTFTRSEVWDNQEVSSACDSRAVVCTDISSTPEFLDTVLRPQPGPSCGGELTPFLVPQYRFGDKPV